MKRLAARASLQRPYEQQIMTPPQLFAWASKDVIVTKQDSELEIDAISGFVTCTYDREWWLACVLEVDTENIEVKVSFLHPYGPTQSFCSGYFDCTSD